jgi:autotransporter-associated beta strand protein
MIAHFDKSRGTTVATAALGVLLLFAGQTAFADVLTWSASTSGLPADGGGTWGTGGNWWNGSADVAWSNGNSDTALFGATAGSTAGTINVSGLQSAGGLVFQSQAYTLAGGTLNLAGQAPVVTVNAGGGTIGLALSGSGGMSKAGSGALTLTVANPYTGTTNINGGTLQLNAFNGASGALASTTVSVASGGFLALDAGDVLGYNPGTAALIINGGTVCNITSGSRVTLANTVTMTGGVLTGSGSGDANGVYSFSASSGLIATSDSEGNAAIVSAGSISLQSSNLDFNVTRGVASPAVDLAVLSSIVPYKGSSYGITKTGNGILTLSGSNTYTGGTTIGGGTLSVNLLANGGAASAIGMSSNAAYNLVLNNGGVLQYTGTSVAIDRGFSVGAGGGGVSIVAGAQLQFGNTLTLSGSFAKTGPGLLCLTNYGGSTVSGGGALVVSQGTLDFGGSYFSSSPFGYRALNIQVDPGGDFYLSAAHALGGDQNDGGTSWGTVSVLGGSMSLAAAQYISGGTVGGLGRLILQGATINNAGGGELRATSNTSCISTLASAQPSTIAVLMTEQYGPYTFDVADGPADADLLISGNLSSSGGSYGITKLNAGKLVLTGSDSYVGTTIGGGTLQIGAGGACGTLGGGAVADNAVLSFARSDRITVANAISGSGSLVQLGPGALVLTGSNTYSGGTVVSGGTLVIANRAALEDGSSLIIGDPALFSAPTVPGRSVAVGSGSNDAAALPVPEPGTWGLLAAALAAMSIAQRRAP